MNKCVNGKIIPLTNQEIAEMQANQTRQYEGIPYEQLVILFIREKYSMDDEFAILRQRDTKPTEFEEYNAYCESCKVKASRIIGGDYGKQ